NGLTKRSISVTGSDGLKYRVVSYYMSHDVLELKRDVLALKSGLPAPNLTGDAKGTIELFRRPSDDADLKAAVAATGIDPVVVYRQHHPDWKPSQKGINRQCRQKSPAKSSSEPSKPSAGHSSAPPPSPNNEYFYLYNCSEYVNFFPYQPRLPRALPLPPQPPIIQPRYYPSNPESYR
ncbi:hypothetical protein HDU98_001024, partial [Podochytrium sp. JEL0797]